MPGPLDPGFGPQSNKATTPPALPGWVVDVGVAGIGTMETQIPSLSTHQAQAVVRAVLAATLPHIREAR